MREITKLMIKKYKLMKLGYDFMGYDITNKSNLRFHHLLYLIEIVKIWVLEKDI